MTSEHQSGAGPGRPDHQAQRLILMLDDSRLFLEVAKTTLEGAGFKVMCASTLEELDDLSSQRPDLVLMDVQMPEAFGDDVAMVLRGVRGVNAPIYLLSSLDDSELAERASEAGVDGFISKRGGSPHLLERVQEILRTAP